MNTMNSGILVFLIIIGVFVECSEKADCSASGDGGTTLCSFVIEILKITDLKPFDIVRMSKCRRLADRTAE